MQIVGRREVGRIGVGPLLLQRDAEERRPTDAAAHDLQELPDADPFLDVVRQVEMRVVELAGGPLDPCVDRARADDDERDQRQREDGTEKRGRTG